MQLLPVLTLSLILAGAGSSALAAAEEPDGYRLYNYDDIVPEGLSGATTVTAAEVLSLQQNEQAVVVDVIPEQRKPDYLPPGQLWIPAPHKGVPGALWLPDTGFGVLSEQMEHYFRHHLQQAVAGDRHHPVVFYCRANCWMSWNAAKRALSYGYTRVFWFADGTDDWFFEGYEFELLQPAAGRP